MNDLASESVGFGGVQLIGNPVVEFELKLMHVTNTPINEIHESPLVMLIPLFLLGIGALFAGVIFKEIFIGHHSKDFWQNSIFFLNEIKHDHIPLWLLLVTPILVVTAIPLSFYYFI